MLATNPTPLLALVRALPGLTPAEWREQFAIRRRTASDLGISTDAELDRQFAALQKSGLIELQDGAWEPVYERMPVVKQGSLFG